MDDKSKSGSQSQLSSKEQMIKNQPQIKQKRQGRVKGQMQPEALSHQEAIKRREQGKEIDNEYQPGDEKYFEVRGYACKISSLQQNVIYTAEDKGPLPKHLESPVMYAQNVYPKDRPVSATEFKHPDNWVRRPHAKRKNINDIDQTNHEYLEILKNMTKEDRHEFYMKVIRVDGQYMNFYKTLIKGMKKKNLIEKPKITLSHEYPKMPKQYILNLALQLGLVEIDKKDKHKRNDQFPINLQDLIKLSKELGYPEFKVEPDVKKFYQNVLETDSPITYLNTLEEVQQILISGEKKISLRAFLHNVQIFLKEKYKLKHIFSKNAAKTRNVGIKQSINDFLGVNWRRFKIIYKLLREQEGECLAWLKVNGNKELSQQWAEMMDKREKMLYMKRIYSKHLQEGQLPFILLSINDITKSYTEQLDVGSQKINILTQFLNEFYLQLRGTHFKWSEAQNFLSKTSRPKNIQDIITYYLKKVVSLQKKKPIQNNYDPFGAVVQVFGEDEPISKQIVQEFILKYTKKRQEEWKIFGEFLKRLRLFYETGLTGIPSLQYVQQQWEWNMVAEWILRQIQKIDSQILLFIQRGLSALKHREDIPQLQAALQAKYFFDPLTFSSFASEKMHTILSKNIKREIIILKEKEKEGITQEQLNLEEALRKYERATEMLLEVAKQIQPRKFDDDASTFQTDRQGVKRASYLKSQRFNLPISLSQEDTEKRNKIFDRIDGNGNGFLSLAEIDKAIKYDLKIDILFNAKPVIIRAFMAAKDCIQSKSSHGDDYIEKEEFRYLLIYLQQYFEYWEMFQQIDTSKDRKLSFEEFNHPKTRNVMKKFGIDTSNMKQLFEQIDTDRGGAILFDEFVSYCIEMSLKLNLEQEKENQNLD